MIEINQSLLWVFNLFLSLLLSIIIKSSLVLNTFVFSLSHHFIESIFIIYPLSSQVRKIWLFLCLLNLLLQSLFFLHKFSYPIFYHLLLQLLLFKQELLLKFVAAINRSYRIRSFFSRNFVELQRSESKIVAHNLLVSDSRSPTISLRNWIYEFDEVD